MVSIVYTKKYQGRCKGTKYCGSSGLLSRRTCDAKLPGVVRVGSGSGSVVEHLLAKEGVEGSNPFFRSNILGAHRA